jgi:hypothetical protein
MSYSHFKDFRCFFPEIWFDLELKEKNDPWWTFAGGIAEFNMLKKERAHSSSWKVVDESFSAWQPQSTAIGGLPNISFIIRKTEPLGTELKCAACPVTGCMLNLAIQ